jgi:hypothetical protein
MRVDIDIRASMISVLGDDLQHVTSPKEIKFFEETTEICSIPYEGLTLLTIGEKASLKFKAPDDSFILRGAAAATGDVDNFIIYGQASNETVTGTVGGLTSSADLKFSRTNWEIGTFITIQDLVISLPQGS